MKEEMVKVYIVLLCERKADEFKSFADFYGKDFCVSTNLHKVFERMSQFAIKNEGCEYSLWTVDVKRKDIGGGYDQRYSNHKHLLYENNNSDFLFFDDWENCRNRFTMNNQEDGKYNISMIGNFTF